MRTLLLAALLLAIPLAPHAHAHIDRASTDRCPPDDIRWWFDHWHATCCTPSTWCAILDRVGPLTMATPELP